MRKTLCISSVILFCLAACAYAYQIKDAHFKQDKKGLVHIYYWLDNPHNDTFEITLMLSDDGGITFQWNMKSVEGDAGDDIRGSGLKHVIWDVEKDHPYLSGNKFVISVDAKRKGKYLGMVFIPAGEFLMGSQAEDLDEHPRHRVYLDAFYMDKYEVANYQYDKCVRAGKCRKQNFSKCWGWSGSKWKTGEVGSVFKRNNHPVICVNWHDAYSYCNWAGKRLPTEAEWEKAARGRRSIKYPWGNEEATCRHAVLDDGKYGCGKNRTWPVGSKPQGVSPYGVMDMSGNVWEWISDWYDSGYYGKSPKRNPKGPLSGSLRVVRGGSWYSSAHSCRSAKRYWYAPDLRVSVQGFRCVASR